MVWAPASSLAAGSGSAGGIAEQVVPAAFDVGPLRSQDFFRKDAFLRIDDVINAALRKKPRERDRQRPCDDEIAQGAEVEDQDVTAQSHAFRGAVVAWVFNPWPRYSAAASGTPDAQLRAASFTTGRRTLRFRFSWARATQTKLVRSPAAVAENHDTRVRVNSCYDNLPRSPGQPSSFLAQSIHAAAQHFVLLVNNHRLPRRHGALGIVEADGQFVGAADLAQAGCG